MAATPLHWEEARNKLRQYREDNCRNSKEVVDIWADSLENYKHKLGDERWMIEEQVFIAGLDCGRLDISEHCLHSLDKQFPGSLRVLKLKAMRFEALERYDDALNIYDSIIREDETNSVARKRKVAVLRGQGRYVDAIRELTEYLKKFMSDTESWQELSDLYLKEGDYSKAAFCLEELILSNPHNHLFYTRYAEIKYTQGGLENMEIARSYFSQAVKLNPSGMRALYGLFHTCTQIAFSSKCSSQKKKESTHLANWTRKKISERYAKAISSVDAEKLLEPLSLLTLADK